MNSTTQTQAPHADACLSDFKPLSAFCEGPAACFPSEASARWNIKKMRQELTQAGALAYDRGRLLLHRERLTQVRERVALNEATRRACRALELAEASASRPSAG